MRYYLFINYPWNPVQTIWATTYNPQGWFSFFFLFFFVFWTFFCFIMYIRENDRKEKSKIFIHLKNISKQNKHSGLEGNVEAWQRCSLHPALSWCLQPQGTCSTKFCTSGADQAKVSSPARWRRNTHLSFNWVFVQRLFHITNKLISKQCKKVACCLHSSHVFRFLSAIDVLRCFRWPEQSFTGAQRGLEA